MNTRSFTLLLSHFLLIVFITIFIDANGQHQKGILQNVTEDETDNNTAYMNYIRSLAFPYAQRMNCLTWDPDLSAAAASQVEKCQSSDNPHTGAVSIDERKRTLKEIIFGWATEQYEVYSDYCNDKKDPNCINYKSIYNDMSDNFGCATAKCDSLPGMANGGYLTICNFDGKVFKHRRPYEIDFKHGKYCAGCSYPKNECISHLCCYPQHLIGVGKR